MSQAYQEKTLNIWKILPQIMGLVPRLPAIIANIKKTKAVKPDDHKSLGKILEQNAINFKDKPALCYEERLYTHGTFNATINQYANYFLSQGVKDGDVVVVFLENRPELVFMIAAMAKIGAVASLVNPNRRSNALIHSIQVDQGNFFVIGEELHEAFEEVKMQLELSDNTHMYWVRDDKENEVPAGYQDLLGLVETSSDQNPSTTGQILAKQRYANVFTSGTTGLPKASIQVHKKWVMTYYWFGKVNLNFHSDDVIYVPIPFFHTNALIVAWPSAAAAGAAIAMRRKFSTSNFWKDVEKYNVSSFIYIGEICRYLLNAPHTPLEKTHRIRKVFGNGLRPEIWDEFKERFNIPKVFEFYGAADGNIAFTNTLNIDYCVGWTAVDFAIVKYDIEHNEPYRNAEGFFERVKKGETGLLLSAINEKFPFDGYVNKSENTRKIFRDVFSRGDTWFNTGDLMRDMGCKHVQFVDRLGDTFRWKGENVATAEVEGVINRLESIRTCTVYGIKLDRYDGRAGMAAITAGENGSEPDLGLLAETLTRELPSYAVPIFIRICDELETTATHKIKKFHLKQEGIDTQDPLFVMLPNTQSYVPLDQMIHERIQRGEYAF